MKALRWISGLLLLGAGVCVSAVPPEDLPETAYNEVDGPVISAPPLAPRLKFTPPADDASILPNLPLYCAGSRISGLVLELALRPTQRHMRSLQDLLSTFLI